MAGHKPPNAKKKKNGRERGGKRVASSTMLCLAVNPDIAWHCHRQVKEERCVEDGCEGAYFCRYTVCKMAKHVDDE